MHELTKGRIKQAGWILGAASAAFVLHAETPAEAHLQSGSTWSWCSPHNATSSNGGSQFFECNRWWNGGEYQFFRTYWCASGTKCANDLCTGGRPACGQAYSKGSTSHGPNGGHKATIDSKICSWSICVEP